MTVAEFIAWVERTERIVGPEIRGHELMVAGYRIVDVDAQPGVCSVEFTAQDLEHDLAVEFDL